MIAQPHLAANLAKAVVRGHSSIAHACTAIDRAIVAGMRKGTLEGTGTIEERVHIDNHILNLHIAQLKAQQVKAIGAITRVLKPLIGIGTPRNRLLAEAHNCNADHGSPLSEEQVEEAAATQVYWAMQRGRRHAR